MHSAVHYCRWAREGTELVPKKRTTARPPVRDLAAFTQSGTVTNHLGIFNYTIPNSTAPPIVAELEAVFDALPDEDLLNALERSLSGVR